MFWNRTDEAWQETQWLGIGDELASGDGTIVRVVGLDWSTRTTGAAYDLTVDEFHSFYVQTGSAEVLVHNCDNAAVSMAERAFTNRVVGVDSSLFGHSSARGIPGLFNRTGSRFKVGWTSSAEFGGGMHPRIGFGRNPLNPNQARWHVDLGRLHVDNGSANPIVRAMRQQRGI